MTKNQVIKIFAVIVSAYPGFAVTEEKLSVWHKALEDQEFNTVERNVMRHVRTEKYPPTIAEIIDHSPKQETSFIDQLAEMRRNAASPEVAAVHKARIRELLNG
jgi:hypothetical protein